MPRLADLDGGDKLLQAILKTDSGFAEALLRIRTKEGLLVPLSFNDAQKALHAKLEQQKKDKGYVRAIVLKGRQTGISTYVAARFFKRTAYDFGKRCMILTHLDAATQNLFAIVKTYFDRIPWDDLKPVLKANSGTQLSFSVLGSGYKVATAGSKNAGRSDTVQFLHGSEVAFWPNAQEIMAGLGQTVPLTEGSEVILESTANGLNNLFHQMWCKACEGKSDYMPVFLPWFVEKTYRRPVPKGFIYTEEEQAYADAFGLDPPQMAFRRAKIDSDFAGNADWFNQEYPATAEMAFQRVGHVALIDTLKVHAARQQHIHPYECQGVHVVGLDPARGGDTSTFIHRWGRCAFDLERINSSDTMAIAGRAARMLSEDETIERLFIDSGGLGAGIYDRLVEMGWGRKVSPVNFGSKADDTRQYFNKRCEMWGRMRDWLHDPITPDIPDDDMLHGDLCSVAGDTFSSLGQLKLEAKEKVREKLGRSPDSADALALTFAMLLSPKLETQYTPNWRKALQRQRNPRNAMTA